jgi:hypothetical protein
MSLSIRDFSKRLYNGSAGTFTWTWTGGRQSSIGYHVTWNNGDPLITLRYRWRDAEDVETPVRLEMTPTQFGGQRWWFTCPLWVNGVACYRRAGKLYLSPGAKYFGCRLCHRLTYRSSQEAHQAERVFAHLGFSAEVARMFNERYQGG